MAFVIVNSSPVPAGYQVELENDAGNKATHTSYHRNQVDAEAEALAAWALKTSADG